MLAYAAGRPAPGKRQSSPHALLIVVSAHVALLAVVMSAKMDLPQRMVDGPIRLIKIKPDPLPPPSIDMPPAPHARHTTPSISNRPQISPSSAAPVAGDGGIADPGTLALAGTAVLPGIPGPAIAPVHHDARLLTPPFELKPPYPPSKILTEEEAVLRLRLTINEQGRVVGVDPIGRADPAFLEAARRHLIAHWRYQPATEDGQAIVSSMIITLRFQLDG